MSKPTPVIPDVTGNVPNAAHDRLSHLPEDIIINHIFSLLGDNDIPRLTSVSKHFHRLAVSSPFLSFKPTDQGRHYERRYCDKYCKSFHKFLHKVISKRPRFIPLRVLTLHFSCDNYRTTLFSFFDYVADCGTLEELKLRFTLRFDGEELMIMKRLINLPSLRVFEFKGCSSNNIINAVMNLASPLTSLQVVVLENLYFFNGKYRQFPTWISQAISLKSLIVRSCYINGNFDLVSSSLEFLEVCGVELSYRGGWDSDCDDPKPEPNMSISCPELESLELRDLEFDTFSVLTINDDCRSLKHLSISDCLLFEGHDEKDILPPACALLESLRIDEADVYLWENSTIAGPFLKEIIISNCEIHSKFDRFPIKGESLSRLTISGCRISLHFDGSLSFDISAPNLQERLVDDSINVNYLET